MKIAVIFISVMFVAGACAQPNRSMYVEKVKEQCKNADVVEVEVKPEYIEIEYLCDGKLFEIGLNSENQILFIESEASISEHTMFKINKKLAKKYYGWTVDEFTYVEMNDTAFYKAELIKDGIEANVYFSMDGKYYRAKNVAVNEQWKEKDLLDKGVYLSAPYNFLSPDKTYEMPEILKEVSGISLVNDSLLFCVQDELGIVFSYSLVQEEITKTYRFTDIGDFEDLAVRGDTVFVLRSDGMLFYFNYMHFDGNIRSTVVPVNSLNVEGLYAHSGGKLYIVSKSAGYSGRDVSKNVYSMPAVDIVGLDVAFSISVDEIALFVKQYYNLANISKINFSPSAIAVHPLTGEYYVLSAENRMIAIFDTGTLKNVYLLPSEIFYKPEGLAFTSAGDLYISSEGMKKGYGNGVVYLFNQKNNNENTF